MSARTVYHVVKSPRDISATVQDLRIVDSFSCNVRMNAKECKSFIDGRQAAYCLQHGDANYTLVELRA